MNSQTTVKKLLNDIETILVEIDGRMSFNDYSETYTVKGNKYIVHGYITDYHGKPVICFDVIDLSRKAYNHHVHMFTTHTEILDLIKSF